MLCICSHNSVFKNCNTWGKLLVCHWVMLHSYQLWFQKHYLLLFWEAPESSHWNIYRCEETIIKELSDVNAVTDSTGVIWPLTCLAPYSAPKCCTFWPQSWELTMQETHMQLPCSAVWIMLSAGISMLSCNASARTGGVFKGWLGRNGSSHINRSRCL